MEELDSLVSRFQALVLTHGPSSNFASCMFSTCYFFSDQGQGVDPFISKILAKPVLAGKIKNEHMVRYTEEMIESLLIVLRGRFIPNKYVFFKFHLFLFWRQLIFFQVLLEAREQEGR